MLMNDLHYGHGKENDENNEKIQQKLLQYLQPDMVVLNGDMVTGFHWDKKQKDYFKNYWKKFTRIFTDMQIPYALTLGNHDTQADLSSDQIADLDRTNPYSLFKKEEIGDIPKGSSNYVLSIYSGQNERKNEITANLWMLDTKKRGCNKHIKKSYGCFNEVQKDFIKQRSQFLSQQQQKQISGLSFFHVPIKEFMFMFNEYPTVGHKKERVSCIQSSVGMFEILRNHGNVKAIYVGHDHDNDYKGIYESVELVYGRKTGYGSYGPEDMQRGATIITLKEFINSQSQTDFIVSSKILQEDGSIVDEQYYQWQGNKYHQIKCSSYSKILYSLISVLWINNFF